MDALDAYLFTKRFLAHATDGHLSDEEWHAIVEDVEEHTRLVGISAEGWETRMEHVGHLYEDTLRDRGPNDVLALFRDALGILQDTYSDRPEALRRLMVEFRHLAAADGYIDPMEDHFLAEIERTWKCSLDGTPRALPAGAASARLHPLFFIKMYIAHAADGDYSAAEAKYIRENLARHAAKIGMDSEARDILYADVLEEYTHLHKLGHAALRRRFIGAIHDVRAHWKNEPEAMYSLIEEIHNVAKADGDVDPEEAAFLVEIASSWQTEDDW